MNKKLIFILFSTGLTLNQVHANHTDIAESTIYTPTGGEAAIESGDAVKQAAIESQTDTSATSPLTEYELPESAAEAVKNAEEAARQAEAAAKSLK